MRRSPRSLVAAAASALLATVAAAPSSAQMANPLNGQVAATVNDDIVSAFDVRQRMTLLILQSGVQPTQDNLPGLQQEALRSIVDDRLRLQEIRRLEKKQKVSIVPNDAMLDQEVADLAKDNGISVEQMTAQMTAAGVGMATLRDQLRAEMSWQRWISGRYGGERLRVGADQVDAFLQRAAEQAAKPQVQLSEVFIDSARAGGQQIAEQGAAQLIEQLRQGAPFPNVARQFSSAPSAPSGGDLGWVTTAELAPEVAKAVEQLRPGQLSSPIAASDGVYIVLVRDKRAGAEASVVSLKQVAIAAPQNASAAQLAEITAKLETLRSSVQGCTDLQTKAAALPGAIVDDLGETDVSDLAPSFQEAARTLQPDEVSHPLRTTVGLHLIAVCGKRQGGGRVPTRAEVENRLRNQQLAMVSRRYLRDLRNSATIESK